MYDIVLVFSLHFNIIFILLRKNRVFGAFKYSQFESICCICTLRLKGKMFNREIDTNWNFRGSDTKEYTHCYHVYPAMMIPQIARTLIQEYKPEGKCRLLFDPYMGSGTSLVEATLANMDSIGTDLNPLARLMAKVKTTRYDIDELQEELYQIQSRLFFFSYSDIKDRDFKRISNFGFWYSEDSLLRLSYLSQLINEYSNNQDFFNVALSEVVREVSFTRNGEFKRFRMKEEQIKKFHPDVFGLFEAKVHRNLNGLKEFEAIAPRVSTGIYGFNSIFGIPDAAVGKGSVDMIVTSPPYGDSRTTVAYGQFSRWANEWFAFDNARELDRLLMGGKRSQERLFKTESIADELEQIRNIDLKRYFEVVSFLNDYWLSIHNVATTVRKGGVVCYVVGNRNVKGIQIPLDYFTAETFERCGLHHVTTLVREIPSKRMPSKTSPTNKCGVKVNTMSNEYIVVLEK